MPIIRRADDETAADRIIFERTGTRADLFRK